MRFFAGASILVTSEKDFEKKNRQGFVSKIAKISKEEIAIKYTAAALADWINFAQTQILLVYKPVFHGRCFANMTASKKHNFPLCILPGTADDNIVINAISKSRN